MLHQNIRADPFADNIFNSIFLTENLFHVAI